MVRITAVHMAGGELHEHIAAVRWINPSTKASGESTRSTMVAFIDRDKHRAVVGQGTQQVEVGVVNGTPKYIRTYADEKWTNNLLALPRY